MASGIQNRLALSGSTWTTLAAGPSSTFIQSLTVSLVNRSTLTTFSLALCPSGTSTPAASDYVEFNMPINANGTYERNGLILSPNQIIMVFAASANVTALCYGTEGIGSANSGIQSRTDVPATTWTAVGSAPTAGRIKGISVNLCNRGSVSVTFSMVISTTPAAPGAADYIEFNSVLPVGGVFERTGIVLNAGLQVGVYCSVANVSCTVYGVDDPA
jgi:hypothetical protein